MQTQAYAVECRSYPTELYDIVLRYHTNTAGKLNQLLDIGCGPRNATRDLSLAFDGAIGVDPSAQMIAVAQSRGGKTRTGNNIKFEVGLAEEYSKVKGVEPAIALKPGGSVALWTRAFFLFTCSICFRS